MMKRVEIITIFPEMFAGPFDYSIVKRAQSIGAMTITIHDLRQWTNDKYQSVDDHPYGGGAGMVMMVEPIHKALTDIKAKLTGTTYVILTSAKGNQYSQQKAQQFKDYDNLIIIAGHYEGVDERVAEHLIDEEISIGKYILTGGELPAMIIVDSIARLLPGSIGNQDSLAEESFNESDTLEYPHYTRPAEYATPGGEIWPVPEVLLSGNHKNIQAWRTSQRKTLS